MPVITPLSTTTGSSPAEDKGNSMPADIERSDYFKSMRKLDNLHKTTSLDESSLSELSTLPITRRMEFDYDYVEPTTSVCNLLVFELQ